MPPGSSSCRERIIFASMQDSNVCDKTLEHPGMALPLSLWRRESDLLLLTVRAPDKRASSRLVRVPDSALLPASVALLSGCGRSSAIQLLPRPVDFPERFITAAIASS